MPVMIYLIENPSGPDYFVPVDRADGKQVARIEHPHLGQSRFVYGEVATTTAARKLIQEQHYPTSFERRFLDQINQFFLHQATD